MTSKSSFGSFSFCCEGDEGRATRSPRELPAVPAEGTTKGGRDLPLAKPRAAMPSELFGLLFFRSNNADRH